MMRRLLFKHIGIGALFFGILFIAFWIRVQGGERLYMKVGDEKVEQFTENDAYLYHWQAKEINKRGILPFRDKHRWLPLGRDNRQLLSLYAYAIAYTHKVFPWFSLYHIQLYAPILCFTIGLGVLFIFLARTYGVIFASIVGLLLATLPGSIERSAIGFGDRDAWCWMLGVLAVTSYLWKEQMDTWTAPMDSNCRRGFHRFFGGTFLGRFRFFRSHYTLCRTVEVLHHRHRAPTKRIHPLATHVCAVAISDESCLSERIRFFNTCLCTHASTISYGICTAWHKILVASTC